MEAKPNKAGKQGIYWLLLVLAVLCIAGAVACWQGSDYYRGYYISERKNYSRYAMENLERWTLVLGGAGLVALVAGSLGLIPRMAARRRNTRSAAH